MAITREQLKVEGAYINRGSKHGAIRKVLAIGETEVFYRTEANIEICCRVSDALRYWSIVPPSREKMEFKAYWVDGELKLLNIEGSLVSKDTENQLGLMDNYFNGIYDVIPAKGVESVWRYTDDWSVCDG